MRMAGNKLILKKNAPALFTDSVITYLIVALGDRLFCFLLISL
jgi:hypothetical protein